MNITITHECAPTFTFIHWDDGTHCFLSVSNFVNLTMQWINPQFLRFLGVFCILQLDRHCDVSVDDCHLMSRLSQYCSFVSSPIELYGDRMLSWATYLKSYCIISYFTTVVTFIHSHTKVSFSHFLTDTSTTTQLDCRQFGRTFRCVARAVTNVASHWEQERATEVECKISRGLPKY